MATVTIPDDVMAKAGMTEHDVLVEMACRLFDAQRLTKTQAGRLCGLTRDEFNAALMERGLPVIRYTEEMLEEDMKAVAKMRKDDAAKGN